MEDRVAAIDPQFEQVSGPVSNRLPLLPVTAAYASSYPVIHLPYKLIGFANAKVAHPASHVLSEFEQTPLHGHPPAAPCQFTYPIFEHVQGFGAPDYPGTSEGKAEELELCGFDHLALFLIYL